MSLPLGSLLKARLEQLLTAFVKFSQFVSAHIIKNEGGCQRSHGCNFTNPASEWWYRLVSTINNKIAFFRPFTFDPISKLAHLP